MTRKRTAAFARDPDRPRILISRMSAIGDTILTTPVLCRLRERFPQAFLAWVVEEKSSQFIQGHPALDETIVLPRGWFVSPPRIVALGRRLRSMRFDAAVDCQSITKSALACWVSGAKLRVGCRGRYGCEMSPWLNNRLIEPRRPHLTDRSLELLAPLDAPPQTNQPQSEPVDWDLPIQPGAEASVSAWAPSGEENGFVVINPGATWDSKLWEPERFGRLAQRLGAERGMPSVAVWGSPREKQWAETIVSHSEGRAVLAPRTTLHELAALLAQARLVVSPDTGPMHLAVAVGTPTVGLFGSTHPDDCGPYGAPHAAVLKRHHDGSRRERRQADNSAMREITVEDALGACQSVLDRTERHYPHAPTAMAS